MTIHALLNPQGQIDRKAHNIDPTVGTKPGWAWVPVEEAPAPAISALEVVSSSYVVQNGKAAQVWTVTRRSLQDQKAAVKREAQRRIIAMTGQSDLIGCLVKQSNANMRANELNDKRVQGGALTLEEEAEAEALRNLAVAIKAVSAKSNDIERLDPIPLNYTDDGYWTA